MDALDIDHNLFARQGAGDDKLFVTFYDNILQNDDKSAEAGRPIFDDVTFIKIITPGDRDNIIDRPLRPEDKLRFPRHWAAYQNGEHNMVVGTPLVQWPLVSRSMAEELKYMGFVTVEQVAAAGDSAMAKMPGLRQLRDRAVRYLEAAAGSAPTTALQKQLDEEKAARQALEAQVAELGALLAKHEANAQAK